jgi:glyceraldehyde 3-phosphate dehydrogenase
MTTIHAYTSTQNIVDGPKKDLRRARAAAVNIIPTSTGAAVATTMAIPSLKNKFDGMAVRVPTPIGSLCDVVYITSKKIDEKKVNQALKKAARSARLKNILGVTDEALVSSDFIGDSRSSVVDLSLTKVLGRDLLKIIAWYANEWGYSNRLVDMVHYIKRKRLV